MTKELILGQIDETFSPDKHVPVAPHCFIGNENLYPLWEGLNFPDPFLEEDYLFKSDMATSEEAIFYTQKLGEYLNVKLGLDHSFSYWKIVLYPWVIIALQVIWNHQQVLLEVLERHKDIQLKVNLNLANKTWRFTDTADFQKSASESIPFVEWIYSILIKEIKPVNCTIHYNDQFNSNNLVDKHEEQVKSSIVALFNSLFNRFQKPYGMNRLEVIFFELLIHFKPSDSCPPHKSYPPKNKTSLNWKINVFEFLLKTMPECFMKLPKNKVKIRNTRNKLWHVSNRLAYDDDVKHRIGIAAESGAHIIASQHGGHNYGSSGICEFFRKVEYETDSFISWGWTSDKPRENIIPLPSPLTSKFLNKHKGKTNQVILVGNRANLIPYRLDNIRPSNWVKYRRFKKDFIENLSEKIRKDFLYKAYFHERGALTEKNYLSSYFPWLPFLNGSLHKNMLDADILIIDHPGTTLNLSMSANIPTLICWPENIFYFNKLASKYFSLLKEAGILFHDPEAAANQINDRETFKRIWYSKEFQKLREEWVDTFAMADKNWRTQWIKTFWRL